MKKIIINMITVLMLLIISNVLSAERISINPAESKSVTWNVLQCHDDYTIIEVLLNHYDKSMISIDDTEFYTFRIQSGALRLVADVSDFQPVADVSDIQMVS